MNRITIINDLITQHGHKSYLEIGVKRGICFKEINCPEKTSVDPVWPATFRGTSDEFFAQNKQTFDIIFIDGLHESHQTKKDIFNALLVLAPGGHIVLHDCLPESEIMQRVPRMAQDWTGDVWKAFVYFRRFPELEMFTYDCDFGVGVIRKGSQEPLKVDRPTFSKFVKNRQEWMNVKPAK